MGKLVIHKLKCQLRTNGRPSGDMLLRSDLLGSDNLKNTFLPYVSGNGTERGLRINKLKIDLGEIPIEQFDTQFNQRLEHAFAQCLQGEETLIGKSQEINLISPEAIKLQKLFHEYYPVEEELFQLALHCLHSVTLKSLIQGSSVYQLHRLLKLLLEGGGQSPKMLPAFWFGRVTPSRLSIAAILYLLKHPQGHDWLMRQHSPTASQLSDWANAITQGEIPVEQLTQLLIGGSPAVGSALSEQRSYAPLIVIRWLLPLWQQLAIRQVIHQLKGARVVQQIDDYLSLCLQPQNSAIEGCGMYSSPPHVVLLQDSSSLRESEYIPVAISGNSMQTRGNYRQLPHEPRSSVQIISNAGLLLLWPLLPQLFSQMGLWEERTFISDAARMQAVYCLDRLVWGKVTTEEERLKLNLVICGISQSSPISPVTPLSVLQQQQIDDWVMAIGQQLVGWQKLSLTDIRQLFLQREGEISTEGPIPQISVWPEPYDYLLKDWPWPMTLASFPWTEQPLTIVWPLNGFTR
ncbi:contractile injection system tape measure protein [Serratia marcescens]|uniref:contractile injection system tape measure protein n=1 Tax=Serratia marcescens TaxID=615 RepID=UPI0027E43942|nr:contractile injection system tape measure protein [Serratia marcescens]